MQCIRIDGNRWLGGVGSAGSIERPSAASRRAPRRCGAGVRREGERSELQSRPSSGHAELSQEDEEKAFLHALQAAAVADRGRGGRALATIAP